MGNILTQASRVAINLTNSFMTGAGVQEGSYSLRILYSAVSSRCHPLVTFQTLTVD